MATLTGEYVGVTRTNCLGCMQVHRRHDAHEVHCMAHRVLGGSFMREKDPPFRLRADIRAWQSLTFVYREKGLIVGEGMCYLVGCGDL
jgi:hypothetical protein